jgi:23S rRNA pseudouridine1911/1915/1917 synthase
MNDQTPDDLFDDDMLDDDLPELAPSGARPAQDIELRPTPADRNVRLDKFIAANIPGASRAWLQRVIDDGHVLVDGRVRGRTFKMTQGQVVNVHLPAIEEDELEPEDIPLTVVHEDADIVVIDKPAGMVVHPAPGHRSGTLVNALLHHYPEIEMAGTRRPGIVHRLDRDTSGLIVVGRTDAGRLALLEQWADRSVTKEYLAILHGNPAEDVFEIDAPIGRDPAQRKKMTVIASGKPARSTVTIVDRFGPASVAEVAIETGRTHQIRVHTAYAGHPVVGDGVYNRYRGAMGGSSDIARRQMLHAARLVFTNVAGEQLDLSAPPPADFERTIAWLEAHREIA